LIVFVTVKLTPGTGKRGKACKTALAIFIGDKATSQRYKIVGANLLNRSVFEGTRIRPARMGQIRTGLMKLAESEA
jgi:hypothetical protein